MAVADEQDDVFDEKLDFIDCARYGEIDEVQAKLNANKTLAMSVDDRKNNALHMASANGHKEIVELLLKSVDDDFRKTLVKAQNVSGNTPLHWAALNGHVAVVNLLMEAGADGTVLNEAGKSPLHEAAKQGHTECELIILKKSENMATKSATEDANKEDPEVDKEEENCGLSKEPRGK